MPSVIRNEEALELARSLGPSPQPDRRVLRRPGVSARPNRFIGPGVSVLDVVAMTARCSRRTRAGWLGRRDRSNPHSFDGDRADSASSQTDSVGSGSVTSDSTSSRCWPSSSMLDYSELPTWRAACERLLVPGGTLLLTVPAPQVDKILDVLRALHLVAGMSAEEHHGFDPSLVPQLFDSRRFRMVIHRRFEMGLNHLFVFRRGANG